MVSAAGFAMLETLSGAQAVESEAALAGVYGKNSADMVLKASVLSSQVVEFMQKVGTLSDGRFGSVGCAAHAGNGIVHVFVNGEEQGLVSLADGLLECASSLGGNVAVCKAPRGLKSRLKISGKPSADWSVMRAIRDKFDPSGVLNPGRFIEAV
jgi:FAD/FMN-containing dehydrogenase